MQKAGLSTLGMLHTSCRWSTSSKTSSRARARKAANCLAWQTGQKQRVLQEGPQLLPSTIGAAQLRKSVTQDPTLKETLDGLLHHRTPGPVVSFVEVGITLLELVHIGAVF